MNKVYPTKGVFPFKGFEIKTLILGALALCLAAPTVASADEFIDRIDEQ
ncbi:MULTISPECIES: hypothetical protein [unclassified Mesorhizobium]|nr:MULTISPECIES: hypothetical protein [unclassified Mesorhizobium]